MTVSTKAHRSCYIDAYRISHLDKWLRAEKKYIRKKEQNICKEVLAHTIHAQSYNDLLQVLFRILDPKQKILLII